ncbi:MAG: VOC family protein [Pseudomonadota bacterium]
MQPTIVPYVAYRDTDAAIDFLSNAFGFEVNMRVDTSDGSESRAELIYGTGSVLVGPFDKPQGNPAIYVAVDDLDPHYRKAMAYGAYSVYPPEDTDWGTRRYCVKDPEGNEWIFCSYSNVSTPPVWTQ